MRIHRVFLALGASLLAPASYGQDSSPPAVAIDQAAIIGLSDADRPQGIGNETAAPGHDTLAPEARVYVYIGRDVWMVKFTLLEYFVVTVDGANVGRMRPGQVLAINVAPGPHRITRYLHMVTGNAHGVSADIFATPERPIYLRSNFYSGLDSADVIVAGALIASGHGVVGGAERGAIAGAALGVAKDPDDSRHPAGEYLEESVTGPDDILKLKPVPFRSR